MNRRITLVAISAALVVLMAACSGATTSGIYAGPPLNYLLTVDQMESPDFLIQAPARTLNAAQLSSVTGQNAKAMTHNGLLSGASTEYFRDVGALSISNGPVDIVATAETFTGPSQASNQFHADIAARESSSREQPISTGPLGDEAHADTELAVAPDADQTSVIQITLEWRLGNILNVLVVRGRYGGARLTDALQLANKQTENELSGGSPRITPSPSSSSSPKKSPSAAKSPSASATP
jgi:hypothetical protein